jgi:very-short-patch-repair endonuclease
VLRGDAHVTLSELERAFLRLLRAAGLPLPVTNRPASGRYVDCRWSQHRLTVELDSYRYHNTRHAWERDRRREREAYARGDQFRRFTYEDVTKRPEEVLAELRPLLTPPESRGASCSP